MLKDNSGLSLIEVAVVLIIFGILLVPTLSIYGIYRVNEIQRQSDDRIHAIENALSIYVEREGHYPRPSHRNMSIGDIGFGLEAPLAGIGDCIVNDPRACRIEGPPPLNPARPDGAHSFDGHILVGAVPIGELGLPINYYTDGYGGQFTYVVTEALTNVDNFGTAPDYNDYNVGLFDVNGRILVVDDEDTPIEGTVLEPVTVPPAGLVHFFIYSHGENNAGTFSENGTLIAPCGQSIAEDGREVMNCDNVDLQFTNNEGETGIGVNAVRKPYLSKMPGPNFFDDFTSDPIVSVTDEPWARSMATAIQTDIYTTVPSNISIADVRAAHRQPAQAKANIHGNLRIDAFDRDGDGVAEPPNLYMGRLCAPRQDNDFDPILTDDDRIEHGYSLDEESPRFVIVGPADLLFWPQRDIAGFLERDDDGLPMADLDRPVRRDNECDLPGEQVTQNPWLPGVFTAHILAGEVDPADQGLPGGGIYCNRQTSKQALRGIGNYNELCEIVPYDEDIDDPCEETSGHYSRAIIGGRFLCHGRD